MGESRGPAAASVDATDWVRQPAVAGLFYPAEPDELAAAVAAHVDGAAAPDPPIDPAALIAPHAGYRYSGPTAGVAYRALAGRSRAVERVVLVGPAHRVPVEGTGVGVTSARAWHTPVGDVPVDVEACRALVSDGSAVVADAAHAPEHSLEVHLPFLLELLGPVPMVPLVVGACPAAAVATALAAVWRDDTTLVVVSSDLSHYLADGEARARDARTRRAIVEGRTGDIGPYDACGCVPIAGLMMAAPGHRLVPRTLAMATSADASGDADRVVGYGSFAFAPPRPLTRDDGAWLVDRARRALAHELSTGAVDALDDREVPEHLCVPAASFVTLERAGELVGCIGSLDPSRPLWRDVALNARNAAFADPRFAPLAADELDRTAIKVSVLSPLERMPAGRDELVAGLRPGVDGLLLESGDRRGTFLPTVWDKLPAADEFVQALLDKAGLAAGGWPADLDAWRYTTDEFPATDRAQA
jgi:AmmeMemoRadiSam system protein B/AmmeMemoRadiSam system protein A